MRTLVHLSDLHFGRVNPATLQPLLGLMQEVKPDLVAISGDLTQRARKEEFQAAREFLDAISFPKIVVPGNHDVPLYNVLSRFLRSLSRYRRYICADLAPYFCDAEIAVAGVNTARSLTFKDGRISATQIADLRRRFKTTDNKQVKIVVTHHPFDLPPGAADGRVVGRAKLAIKALAECRVDLLLAGHYHLASVSKSATRFRIPGYSALVVSAGTSTSTRGRGQANSVNVLQIDHAQIGIQHWDWQAAQAKFAIQTEARYLRSADEWLPAS